MPTERLSDQWSDWLWSGLQKFNFR